MAWPGLEQSSQDVCEDLRVARKMNKDAFQGIPWRHTGAKHIAYLQAGGKV